MLVYTSEQTATSRYLSLSLLSPQSGGKSQLPPQREPRRLPPQATDLALRSKLGVNAIPCRRYNPSVGFADSSPYTGEPRFALRKATVMRTRILSVTPINPLGVTAPLINKGSRDLRLVAAVKTLHRGAEKNFEHGAGAPSPPSEEGGGCLHKGFEQADGGRDTPSMCEST